MPGPTGCGSPGVGFKPGEERAFGIARPGVACPGQDEILTVGSTFVVAQVEAFNCASAELGPIRPGNASRYNGRYIVIQARKSSQKMKGKKKRVLAVKMEMLKSSSNNESIH